MKAVGLYQYLPVENDQALVDVQIDQPHPMGKDLLVHVRAIAVNPVDYKVRTSKSTVEASPRILGWDAAGEVIGVGPDVENFAIGDQVFYAGCITRPGCNSEYHLVDERIVGEKPTSLSFAEAAALPLTSITAWEALFERLDISLHGEDEGQSILIIGGAGGVGSIAIQLAKQLAKLQVIATASRPESIAWVKKLGADHVVNHRNALDKGVNALGMSQVDYILCLNDTTQYWSVMGQLITPQGRICSIVETTEPVDLGILKSKSAAFVWEFMFTRSMYQTADMIEQHRLLTSIAKLIDEGQLVTTLNEVIRPIDATNLRKAHAMVEQGRSIGKVVLADWE